MEEKDFIDSASNIITELFKSRYNYEVEDVDDGLIWVQLGFNYDFGFAIQHNSIGIFFERDIPEIPGVTISELNCEDTLRVLESRLLVFIRDLDRIKNFYDNSVIELLKEKKNFKPHEFKLNLIDKYGWLTCYMHDTRSGVYQEIKVKYHPETGATFIRLGSNIKRMVKDYKDGYDLLYRSRAKGVKSIYLDESFVVKRRHCVLTKESEKYVASFPGWKSILDVSEDLEVLKSI